MRTTCRRLRCSRRSRSRGTTDDLADPSPDRGRPAPADRPMPDQELRCAELVGERIRCGRTTSCETARRDSRGPLRSARLPRRGCVRDRDRRDARPQCAPQQLAGAHDRARGRRARRRLLLRVAARQPARRGDPAGDVAAAPAGRRDRQRGGAAPDRRDPARPDQPAWTDDRRSHRHAADRLQRLDHRRHARARDRDDRSAPRRRGADAAPPGNPAPRARRASARAQRPRDRRRARGRAGADRGGAPRPAPDHVRRPVGAAACGRHDAGRGRADLRDRRALGALPPLRPARRPSSPCCWSQRSRTGLPGRSPR